MVEARIINDMKSHLSETEFWRVVEHLFVVGIEKKKIVPPFGKRLPRVWSPAKHYRKSQPVPVPRVMSASSWVIMAVPACMFRALLQLHVLPCLAGQLGVTQKAKARTLRGRRPGRLFQSTSISSSRMPHSFVRVGGISVISNYRVIFCAALRSGCSKASANRSRSRWVMPRLRPALRQVATARSTPRTISFARRAVIRK